MKKIKVIILLILVLLTYSFIIYYQELKYIEQLQEDSRVLKEDYISFNYNYFDAFPKNTDDVKKMIDWTELVSGPSRINTFKYGFNVKYDSILNISHIYTFGKDRKDNKLIYTPFNSETQNKFGQYPIKSINYFKYIINTFKDKDIILGTLSLPIINCDSLTNIQHIEDNNFGELEYEAYKGIKNVLTNDKNRKIFLKQIHRFENEINGIEIDSASNMKIVYFMYNNDKIETICKNNISPEIISKMEKELQDYFSNIDPDYFDYALFPIRIINNESE